MPSIGSPGAKPAAAREADREALLDDDESVHSRHALKVFKNGSSRQHGSPFSSSITVDSLPAPTPVHSSTMNEEEAAEWRKYRNKTLIRAAIQLVILFTVCSLLLFVTLYFALPKIDECVSRLGRAQRLSG